MHLFIIPPPFPMPLTPLPCKKAPDPSPQKRSRIKYPAPQPVEKPAPAIKPEQVFCLETKAERGMHVGTEKTARGAAKIRRVITVEKPEDKKKT